MDPYPVPFRVDRSRAPRYQLINASTEALRWVRVEMRGPGLASARVTPVLRPGDAIDVIVRGDSLAWNGRLCVCWRRTDGAEYLWSISF